MLSQEQISFQIKEFKDAVYNGELMNGLQHGSGCQFWDTGEIYSGKWKGGKMSGEGIFFFAYGGYIIGEF